MNDSPCPIACPLAWSAGRESACTQVGFCLRLPANDFPVVSPRSSADRCSPAWDYSGDAVGVDECRGVVVRCPIARPLARLGYDLPLLPTALHLPAKEKKNEGQPAAGGQL